MSDNHYLDLYEDKLTEILIEQCVSKGVIEKMSSQVTELDEKWELMAPQYMADAVPEVREYPSAAIAWAAYLGMAVAVIWDRNSGEFDKIDDLYKFFCEPRGFDLLDEYITEKYLSLDVDSAQSKAINDVLSSCVHSAVSLIRKEQVEPQSAEAFYIFARTTKLFFRLGVAMQLKTLGYTYMMLTPDMLQEFMGHTTT